jgi:hypothetical protein
MPIVFEEVTGEIAPSREAGPSESSQSGGSDSKGDDVALAVRDTLQMLRERERRLRAD